MLSVHGPSCHQEHGPPPGSSVFCSRVLYRAHKPLSISIKKSSSSLGKGKICRVKIRHDDRARQGVISGMGGRKQEQGGREGGRWEAGRFPLQSSSLPG